MGAVAQTASVSPELEAAAARVLALATAEQLQLLELLQERLAGEVDETKADQKAQMRAEALKALGEVADKLGKPGEMPTPTEFDETAAIVAPGWNRSRVVRAWGRWRFAKTAYLGGTVRTTTENRTLQSVIGTSKARSVDVYLAFIRKWLDANPATTYKRDYQRWVVKYNEQRGPDDAPAPSSYRIYSKVRITWEDIVRVARGEISIEEGRPTKTRDRQRVCTGPHDLLSIVEIQELLDTTRPTANATTRKPGFPVPVYSTRRLRLWMRGDVEAWFDGKPLPQREEDELGAEYIGVDEVADRLGVSPVSVAAYSVRHLPRPTVNLGGVRLWHAAVVADTLEKRAHRGRLGKNGAPAAKLTKLSG